MFCPQCKCEYIDGVTECVDCQVKLVYELPTEEKEVTGTEGMTYVGMYRIAGQAEMVKDFLRENGIEAVTIEYPFDLVTRVYVPQADAGKAGELIQKFEESAASTRQAPREETPEELKEETADEREAEKPGFLQFFMDFRQWYVKISWLLAGTIWLLFGIFLILEWKKYLHGIVLTAIALVIFRTVIRHVIREKKKETDRS